MARYGFTTGSCSAAAAKAASYMLLSGKKKEGISIETPKGITFDAKITDIKISESEVSCAVIKYGGDDPDITTGAHVFARVSYLDDGEKKILISGGVGVGVVTRPGLDQPVGEAAINSTPRRMIEKEVLEVMELFDYQGSLNVTISIPEGVELAKKTFNPKLGIKDGISVLGTTGIVEPMSLEAIRDTIFVELRQKRALGHDYVAVSFGNYGLEFMKRTYDFDLDKSVKCSNFVGDTVKMAKEFGFRGMLLCGHIGKLSKVAGGMLNTHSKYGDCRIEVIKECVKKYLDDEALLKRLSECVVTEDAVDLIDTVEGLREKVMDEMMQRILENLRRGNGEIEIECMMYSNKHGLLAKSDGAMDFLDIIRKEMKSYE